MFCEIICKVTGITHPVAKGNRNWNVFSCDWDSTCHAIRGSRRCDEWVIYRDLRDYYLSRGSDFCRIYLNERLTVVGLFILAGMTDNRYK